MKEGGDVSRIYENNQLIPGGNPSQEKKVELYDLDEYFDYSVQQAKELRSLGFNWNLVPVIDLKGEGNPMGDRPLQ